MNRGYRRLRRVVVGLAVTALGVAAGCHDTGGTASCTMTSGGAQVCEENADLTGTEIDNLEQDCLLTGAAAADGGASPAVFSRGPCPRDHALGGCRIDTGGPSVTVWYYEDGRSTRAEIQAFCTNSGTSYVAP